ncbi:hypothetical protein BJ508DRAFT_418845 [Ascobolus immersus RN42]|uniref:F-box domain-containing protein n=1 Tax=Ascobolus immersus RN42 TaxID=1160509 RepID=A0A3N4HPB9_ASCIM|nr:hypothetical protein BJ508DRAFT_418845 [Ascobolus immersus RN42]
MAAPTTSPPTTASHQTLTTLLSNPLILHTICTHLPLPSLTALTLVNHTFANLILHTPSTHRTITIPSSHAAHALSRLFSLPLFQRDTQILRFESRTSLPLQDLARLLTTTPHRVRILSLLNSRFPTYDLSGFLLNLLNTLPTDSPLKALYLFSTPTGSVDKHYLKSDHRAFWVGFIKLARERGVLLDADVCRSSLHDSSLHSLPQQIADVFLPKPCAGCGITDGNAVLKTPVPLETADLTNACLPAHLRDSDRRHSSTGSYRCGVCCEGRVCRRCDKWWCETCLPGFREPQLLRRTPGGSVLGHGNLKSVKGVWLGCDSCEAVCAECLVESREMCGRCGNELCGEHEKIGSTRKIGSARNFDPRFNGKGRRLGGDVKRGCVEEGTTGVCHDCWRGLQHNPRRMFLARLA